MAIASDNKNLQALLLAVSYTVVIGIGMYTSYHVNGITYGDPRMVETLWLVEIILTILALGFTFKYSSWSGVGFGKICLRELAWLVIPALVIGQAWWQFASIASADIPWTLFALLGFTTLLVGFSEELVYRGFVLRKLLQTCSLWQAMLISAVLFSLLHSVNIFAGVNPQFVANQLISTFIFGMFFAPLALRINNLWPIIIIHWQWDFMLLSMAFVPDVLPVFTGFLTTYNIIITIVLWILLLWHHPRYKPT